MIRSLTKPSSEWPKFEPSCLSELNGRQAARNQEWDQLLLERVVGRHLEDLISNSLFALRTAVA